MNVSNLLKKNKILFFFSFWFLLNVNGQSKRFYYGLNFKVDTLGNTSKDILVLEINKNSNIFLSNDYVVTDSLNNIKKGEKNFAYPKFKQVVEYQKSDDSFNFINNLSMNYYKFNTKKKMNWKIVNEKKKLGQFEVTKAMTDFGGRHWTAWFCQEIQFPYGPYVFYGLPGLILEVYDDENNYNFSFIQNKNYSYNLESENIIKKLFDDRKIDINEKDWNKVQINYYKNPISEYKLGNAVIMKDNGEEYNATDYRNLEQSIQKQIKINNNPIEIDNKIKYK